MTSSAVGLRTHSRLRAVLDLEQHVARGFVAAALLPDFRRLKRGHEHFNGAGAVHFLADNLLDLVQRAQAERQKGINAAGELADQPGAQQQFVRQDFRLGGRFAEGRNQSLWSSSCGGKINHKGTRERSFFYRR